MCLPQWPINLIPASRKHIPTLLTMVVTTFVLSVYHQHWSANLDSFKMRAHSHYFHQIPGTLDLAWYFSRGYYEPESVNSTSRDSLWPTNGSDDRIITQLMYVPKVSDGTVKKIYLSSANYYPFQGADNEFRQKECPVSNCEITSLMKNADAVVFKDRVTTKRKLVSSNQIWIVFILENPLNGRKNLPEDTINWTATYRTDSDLVTPYSRWAYYDEKVRSREQGVNYALGKHHKVAWIVSNCRAKNRRMEYALELQKYIAVDIFGSCGTMSCPESKDLDCYNLLSRNYKFYLSFENGNCIDYITEKFYHNALGFNLIPIAMGARREDYRKVAPHHSYIHVEDFQNAKSLADYLHLLDRNDTLYNSYFLWKGTGEFINTRFFCRLCAMLNGDPPVRRHRNLTLWWSKPGTCVRGRWDGPK